MVVDIFVNEFGQVKLIVISVCLYTSAPYLTDLIYTFTRLDFDISQPVMSCYHSVLAGNQLTFLWSFYA